MDVHAKRDELVCEAVRWKGREWKRSVEPSEAAGHFLEALGFGQIAIGISPYSGGCIFAPMLHLFVRHAKAVPYR
jgi:hypothetical protein